MIPNWRCGNPDLRGSWGNKNMVVSRENVENLLVQQKDGRDSHIQWAGGAPPVPDPCYQVWKSVWGIMSSIRNYRCGQAPHQHTRHSHNHGQHGQLHPLLHSQPELKQQNIHTQKVSLQQLGLVYPAVVPSLALESLSSCSLAGGPSSSTLLPASLICSKLH